MSKFLWILLIVAVLVGGTLVSSMPASANDAGQQVEQSVTECRAMYRHQTGVDAKNKPVYIWKYIVRPDFCYNVFYDEFGTPWYVYGRVVMIHHERNDLPDSRTP